MTTTTLTPLPLTAAAFALYGQILAARGTGRPTNDGRARRFEELAELEHHGNARQPVLDLYRVQPSLLPLDIDSLECHPLSSQAFIPMGVNCYLVVVALPGADGEPDPATLQAFKADFHQGINYRPGIWHFPITALAGGGDFAMFMWRAPAAEDCRIATLSQPIVVAEADEQAQD